MRDQLRHRRAVAELLADGRSIEPKVAQVREHDQESKRRWRCDGGGSQVEGLKPLERLHPRRRTDLGDGMGCESIVNTMRRDSMLYG